MKAAKIPSSLSGAVVKKKNDHSHYMDEERAERLPLPENINGLIVSDIEKSKTPQQAIALIDCYRVEVAVAIIDNLDQLCAAFIVCFFRLRAENGDTYAQELVAKVDKLHIRGSHGLTYAARKVYQETGIFVGM